MCENCKFFFPKLRDHPCELYQKYLTDYPPENFQNVEENNSPQKLKIGSTGAIMERPPVILLERTSIEKSTEKIVEKSIEKIPEKNVEIAGTSKKLEKELKCEICGHGAGGRGIGPWRPGDLFQHVKQKHSEIEYVKVRQKIIPGYAEITCSNCSFVTKNLTGHPCDRYRNLFLIV